ncbi:MAG: ABC transporter permease [Thermohalobaculum sp.]|nr:ABC transporter permease [Thermohalobaculum sp.]
MRGEESMGVRRFGAVNWLGLWTLYVREVRRFASVWTQTILAPLATAALFMVVFTLAFAGRRGAVEGLPFEVFLAPGILMMAVLQNAFANTSSSLVISKVQGNIVDTLMPPLSAGEIVAGYVAGGVTRGLACAVAIGVLLFPAAGVGLAQPVWALVFAVQGALMLSLLGVLGGIHAEKFDQMAALTNFVIMPLSFLSGTFYSITVLPEPFLTLSHLNPFFYLIDGFRHGALGQSDASPWLGLAVATVLNAALWALAWRWVATGYRLKS